MTPTHTDKTYEQELKDLRDRLLAMGGKVETAIAQSVRAVTERDASLAEHVKASDLEVNRLEVEIDNACRRLLALMMEDARAIRRATALMFCAKHLERFGDHAINVAEMVVYMVRGTDVRHPRARELGR